MNLAAYGFRDIVINVHHFAGQIVDFVKSHNSFGLNISFSDETDLLRDTGGGIRHARRLLDDGEPFLVHNVDIISNLNLADFYRRQCDLLAGGGCPDSPGGRKSYGKAIASVLVSERVTNRYLLFDDYDRLVAWTNLKTGEVVSPYPELNRRGRDSAGVASVTYSTTSASAGHCTEALHRYAFAGIHVISPEIFPLMERQPEVFPIVPFYLSIADKYVVLGGRVEDLKLMDVGKAETLPEAEAFLKSCSKP
jgi:NDP-sugar pyrophosphorylase family protein